MAGGDLDGAPLLPQLHQQGQPKVHFSLYTIGTLLVAIAIPVAGGFLVSAFGGGGDSQWFKDLNKPSWTPPSWVFPIIWTTLYILIGVASWLVWSKGGFRNELYPLGFYVLQLLLNFAWSPIFFGLHRPDIALGEIILLWIAIVVTAYFFFTASHLAGYLFIPYILWVTIATVLNGFIWKNNSGGFEYGEITTPLQGGTGGAPSA